MNHLQLLWFLPSTFYLPTYYSILITFFFCHTPPPFLILKYPPTLVPLPKGTCSSLTQHQTPPLPPHLLPTSIPNNRCKAQTPVSSTANLGSRSSLLHAYNPTKISLISLNPSTAHCSLPLYHCSAAPCCHYPRPYVLGGALPILTWPSTPSTLGRQ